jgi:hypothetical protein
VNRRPERFITAVRHLTGVPGTSALIAVGARTSDGHMVTSAEVGPDGVTVNHSDDSWTLLPWHLVAAVYGTYGVDAALQPAEAAEPATPTLCALLGHSFDTVPVNGWQTCTACEAAVYVGPTPSDPDREA